MGEDSENCLRAAQLCRGALHGRAPPPSGGTAAVDLLAARIYHSALYRWLYATAALAWLALAFVEPPVKASAATAALPPAAARALDAAFLALAWADLLLLQRYVYGAAARAGGWTRRGWLRVKLVVLVALSVNLAAVAATAGPGGLGGVGYGARVLRPLLFVERLRNLRKAAGSVVTAAPSLVNVGVLLLAQLFVFAVGGVLLFNGMDGDNCRRMSGVVMPQLGCSAYVNAGAAGGAAPGNAPTPFACKLFFTSLDEASIHLFALGAGGSNMPMVMMPLLRCAKANALFFVAFVSLAVFNFGVLTQAVAAACAGDIMRDEVVAKVARAFSGCDMAFALLLGGNAGSGDQLAAGGTGLSMAAAAAGTSISPNPMLLAAADPKAAHSPEATAAATSLPLPQTLPLRRILALFSYLRPDLSPRVVTLFVEVCRSVRAGGAADGAPPLPSAGSGEAALTQQQFRLLVTVFAQLRVAEKRPGSDAKRLVDDGAGRLAWICRACGRGSAHILGPAPLDRFSAAVEDAEWLDGDDVSAVSPLSSSLAEIDTAADSSVAVPSWGQRAQHQPSGFCSSVSEWRKSLLYALAPVPLSAPHLGSDASPLRAFAAAAVSSAPATVVFDGAILINTSVEIYRLSTEVEGTPPTPTVSALINTQRVMLAIFAVEFFLKLAVYGPVAYLRVGWGQRLDAIILSFSLGSGFAEAAGAVDANVALVFQLLRSLRLGRYAQKLRLKLRQRAGVETLSGIGPTVAAGADVIPLLIRFALLLAAAIYAFAIAGEEAFAGKLTLGSPLVAASAWAYSPEPRLTFDSFGSSLLSTFSLLVRSNFPVLMEGCVAATNSRFARSYFVLFIIFVNGTLVPLLAGFSVSAFSTMKKRREAVEDANAEDEASGVFDWMRIVRRSGQRFSGLVLARNRYFGDALDAFHRGDVMKAFPDAADAS